MSSITVGVYLGKKDRLVRYWYEILPKGQFPMLVKYCIQSYLRNNYFPLQSICDAQTLKEQIHKRGDYVPTQRNVTFTPEDGPVYQWIKSLESGYRSEEIKNILKETVVHTLLDDQPLFPPRPINQGDYGTTSEARETQQVYQPYQEEVQKVTVLKREQGSTEDGSFQNDPKQQVKNQQQDQEQKKEKSKAVFSNLVNYSG